MYKSKIKPVFDMLFSSFGLIILSPILFLIIIVIKFDSPGPLFFRQERVGQNNESFMIYKFRTMKVDAPKDIPTHLLENPEIWITSIGRILRRTSIDELPQLFNVIKGDMSIIGPRPALWNQTDLIQMRTLNGSNQLKPGITGWAQVNGRDNLTSKTKAMFDKSYYENVSFITDIKCILLTIKKVLFQENIK